jgi:hypothetical protein
MKPHIVSLCLAALLAQGCAAQGSLPAMTPQDAAARANAVRTVAPDGASAQAHLYVLESQTTSSVSFDVLTAVQNPQIAIFPLGLGSTPSRTIADELFGPAAMTADSTGNLYVAFGASKGGGAAVAVFAHGSSTPERIIAGPSTGLSNPQSIAVGGGRIFVGNQFNGNLAAYLGSVTVYDANASGDAKPLWTLAGNKTGIGTPLGVLTDTDGDIYVLSQGGFDETSLGGMLLMFQGNQRGDVSPAYKGPATDSSYPVNFPSAGALAWYGGDVAVMASGGDLGYNCIQPGGNGEVVVFGAGPGIAQAPVNCFPIGQTFATPPHAFAPCGAGFWVATSGVNAKTGATFGVLDEFGTNGNKNLSVHGSSTGVDAVNSIVCSAGRPTIANVVTGTIEAFAGNANGNVAPSSTIDTNPIHLYVPTGIAVEADGSIAIADAGSPFGAAAPRISIFAPAASGAVAPRRTILSTAFGPWQAGCGSPMQGLAADAKSNLYVSQIVAIGCDTNGNPAPVVDVFSSKASGKAVPMRAIPMPTRTVNNITFAMAGWGLATDAQSRLYAAGPGLIDVFATPNAPIRTIHTDSSAGAMSSSAIDAAGAVAIAGGASGTGNTLTVIPTKGASRIITGTKTKLAKAGQAALTQTGAIYVANDCTATAYGVESEVLSFAEGAHGNVAPSATIVFPNCVQGVALGP